jgi:hypothetical protein
VTRDPVILEDPAHRAEFPVEGTNKVKCTKILNTSIGIDGSFRHQEIGFEPQPITAKIITDGINCVDNTDTPDCLLSSTSNPAFIIPENYAPLV